MNNILLQETGSDLWQENGDHILLDVWFPVSSQYQIEVRNTSGALIAILENAYDIKYVAQINVPHYLSFALPAWDTKVAYLLSTYDYWLVRNELGSITQTAVRKFRLQNHRKIRNGDLIEVRCEYLDLMSELSRSTLNDYVAGMIMTYEAETAAYPNITTNPMIADDDYFYIDNANVAQAISKYRKSDMALVGSTAAYGGIIAAFCQDDTYIYVGGFTTRTIRRYQKTTLAFVDESVGLGGDITALGIDGTYIYASDITSKRIKRYTIAALAFVDQSGALAQPTYTGITVDDDYVYSVGDDGLRKHRKIDLVLDSLTSLPTSVGDMVSDDYFLYLTSGNEGVIRKYSKGGVRLVATTEDKKYLTRLGIDDDYIYAYSLEWIGGAWQSSVRRYTKGLEFIDSSADFGDIISAIISDGEYVLVKGSNAEKVVKRYSAQDTVEEIIDDLFTYQVQVPAITKGDVTDYAALVRNIKADGQSILQTLQNLRDAVGGYLEVDNDRELNWTSSIGEVKGQQIRYEKNLLGIEREIDYNFYNRIYAYGYDRASGLKVRLSEIQANDYVEDPPSQALYGIKVGVFVSFTALSRDTLLEWANQLLAQYKDPVITYRIDTVNLGAQYGRDFESLQLGSTVVIIDEELGIDVSATVVKITYPDLLNPINMQVEVSNVTRNITDTTASLNSEQKRISMEMLKTSGG